MNRRQRRAHAVLWPALALIMIATFGAALIAKSDVHRAQRAAIAESR